MIRDIRFMLNELSEDGSNLSHVTEEKDTHGNAFLFSARKQNKTVNQVIAECPADKLINLFV